jgi:hypothetical protein
MVGWVTAPMCLAVSHSSHWTSRVLQESQKKNIMSELLEPRLCDHAENQTRPERRACSSRSFENTGVDYDGPENQYCSQKGQEAARVEQHECCAATHNLPDPPISIANLLPKRGTGRAARWKTLPGRKRLMGGHVRRRVADRGCCDAA